MIAQSLSSIWKHLKTTGTPLGHIAPTGQTLDSGCAAEDLRVDDRQDRDITESLGSLRAAMLVAGDRLLAELAREERLNTLSYRASERRPIEQWKECRHSVERLAGEYTEAIGAYRRAMLRAIDE